MLKLRTKTEKTVPAQFPLRGTVNVVVKIIIDEVSINKNGITPKGYYYYLDENNRIVKLDSFGQKAYQSREVITQIENNGIVPPFNSNYNVFDVIEQRLEEFTWLTQEIEVGQNYGIIPSDLELDIDIDID